MSSLSFSTPAETKDLISARLTRRGLIDLPVVHSQLTAYTFAGPRGRWELGEHQLVDVCVDRESIMRQYNHDPNKNHAVKFGSRWQSMGSNSNSVFLEYQGQCVGYVRYSDGVFMADVARSEQFLAFIEATDCGPVTEREHRGLRLAVSSQELMVLAYAGREKRLQEQANPSLTTTRRWPVVPFDSELTSRLACPN